MNAIICDKCDKILPTDGDYIMLIPMVECEIPRYSGDKRTHLCLDCFEDFKRWVEQREEPVQDGGAE